MVWNTLFEFRVLKLQYIQIYGEKKNSFEVYGKKMIIFISNSGFRMLDIIDILQINQIHIRFTKTCAILLAFLEQSDIKISYNFKK